MAAKKPKKTSNVVVPTEGQLVRITNRGGRDGHRRAGIKHPRGERDHAHDAFELDQLEALYADPKLEVRIVDAPKPEDAK